MQLKDYFLSFIKGAIIGIANIIPGVSGGTLAVSLGIYEVLLDAIGNFFKNIKKNIKILLPIILGAAAGILSGGKLISYTLEHYKAQTLIFFIGLILGGLSLLTKKIKNKVNYKNVLLFAVVFALVILFNFSSFGGGKVSLETLNFGKVLSLIPIGFLAGGTMVVPGISGSFVMMVLGYYESIINTIANLTNFSLLAHNMIVLIPFGIGVLLGIILIAKLISYLLKKYETKTYFGIIGFVLSSIVILILQIDSFKFSFMNIITCLIMFFWGYLLARAIEKE